MASRRPELRPAVPREVAGLIPCVCGHQHHNDCPCGCTIPEPPEQADRPTCHPHAAGNGYHGRYARRYPA